MLSQVLPDRLSILADGLAATVLAVALDLALTAASRAGRGWWRQAIPVAIAVTRRGAADPAAPTR